jgi:hypothetical protein
MLEAALLVWELPQNAVGLLALLLARARGEVLDLDQERNTVVVYTKSIGVSLGRYVFYSDGNNRWFRRDPLMRQHELGHRVQSRWLGPLYLPLVGVPSTMRVIYAIAYRELTGNKWAGYSRGYPESWADRLGGITRAQRAAQLAAET